MTRLAPDARISPKVIFGVRFTTIERVADALLVHESLSPEDIDATM
jgi:hypothetical protein